MDRHDTYQERIKEFQELEAEHKKESDRLSNWRLLAFIGAIICGVVGTLFVKSVGISLVWFIACLISFGLFIWLVIKHRNVIEECERFALMRKLNEDAIHRLNREWESFPVPSAPEEFAKQNAAGDLDLFGEHSLFQVVCTQSSPQGRYTLAQWFVNPGEIKEIKKRQDAVDVLSEQLHWRQEQAALGQLTASKDAELFPNWIQSKPWTEQLPDWFPAYLKWSPWVFLVLFILFFVWLPIPLFLLFPAFNVYLTRKYRQQIFESNSEVLADEKYLRSYEQLFSHLTECDADNRYLSDLVSTADEAASAMDDLNNIANRAAVNGSMVYPLFMAILLWDFRIAKSIEHWQATYSSKVKQWFTSLGEFEALASLASLRYDEPDWVFPKLNKSGAIEADTLGHPLISSDVRVSNSVNVGPEGRFVLVTGSNMSGKSTLLRSIGLNVTLAQAGGVVCAKALAVPKVSIASSMRVQDSLSDGLSFFMAELKRIKEVVLQAKASVKEDRAVLFLLDEILQGTNTVERREIVQRVMAHLVKCNAIGLITTHDLALAEMDNLTDHADLIHFRETFTRDDDGKPSMTFDYQIREGVATTTNALKILEVIEMPV